MSDNSSTVIGPKKKLGQQVAELLASRELIWYFIWRNFKIKYKQTLLGASWAVLRPLVLMIVFTIFFSRSLDPSILQTDVPYPVFSYAGLLFWTYFSQTVNLVGDSLVSYQSILTKVYFPRLIAPLSASLTGIIDFFFASIVYAGLLAYFGVWPGLDGILMFFVLLFFTFLFVFGFGTFMAALNVRYRDVGQAFPFILQVMLFATPVIYPANILPDQYSWVLFLNPMTAVVELSRASLLNLDYPSLERIGLSVAVCVFMLVFSLIFFRSKEREFADIV